MDIENTLDLLAIFQSFYHNTGRFPLTNGLLIVPDGDAPNGEEKINMKNLYEMFQHTKSHGLVSLPFLGALHMFFDGKNIDQVKNALTELYKNLSYATLSGARTFDFDAISDLVGRVSFLIKGSTLLNRDRRERENEEKAREILDKTSFYPKPDRGNDTFQELVDNLDKNLEHKKTTHPYIEPTLQDPVTIETETQAIDDEFDRLKQQFNEINDAVTKQKKQGDAIKLVDDILDKNNPFKNVNTEDLWIKDNLFNNNDKEAIKDISKDIISTTSDIINTTNDIKNIDDNFPLETIVISDDVEIPFDRGIAPDTGPS